MADELKPTEPKPELMATKDDIEKVLHALDDKQIDGEEVAAAWRLWDEVKPIIRFIVAILAALGIWTGGEAVVDSMSASAPPPKIKDEPAPAKLTLEVPAEIEATIGGTPAAVTAKSAGKVTWLLPPSAKASGFESNGAYVIVPLTGAADFDLGAVSVKGEDVVSKWVRVKVKGGIGPRPPPVPDDPTDPLSQILEQLTRNTSAIASLETRLKALEDKPGPKPDPKPDPPKPPVPTDKGPFGGAPGLHVLIVYERTGKPLTAEQVSVVYGEEFRKYVEQKAAKGPDGAPQRRIWDKDVDLTGAEPIWRAAMARRPASADFWLAIGNGDQWYEGPWPATLADMMVLVKKYGG